MYLIVDFQIALSFLLIPFYWLRSRKVNFSPRCCLHLQIAKFTKMKKVQLEQKLLFKCKYTNKPNFAVFCWVFKLPKVSGKNAFRASVSSFRLELSFSVGFQSPEKFLTVISINNIYFAFWFPKTAIFKLLVIVIFKSIRLFLQLFCKCSLIPSKLTHDRFLYCNHFEYLK